VNLFVFCHNNSDNRFDLDGRVDFSIASMSCAQAIAIGWAGLTGAAIGAEIDHYLDHYIYGSFMFAGVQSRGALNAEGLLYGGVDADDGFNWGAIGGWGGKDGGGEYTYAKEASWSQYGGGMHVGDAFIAGLENKGGGFGAIVNQHGQLALFVYANFFKYAFVGAGVDVDVTGSH
jgi:hypothetical protein